MIRSYTCEPVPLRLSRMKTDDRSDRLLQAFQLHRPRMERQVMRRIGCAATTADLLQSLFLRLWRRPPQVTELSGAYLVRSARNIAIDHQRAQAARPEAHAAPPEDMAAEQPDAERIMGAAEEYEIVRTTLRALPDRTRQIFLLNRARGLPYGTIAAALGVSVSTVEKEMMRALAACRAALPER